MPHNRRTAIAGMIACPLATAALMAGGAGVGLSLAVGAVWGLALWFDGRGRFEKEEAPPPPHPAAMPSERAGLIAAIEPLSAPVLLTDARRIIAANAAAREVLGAHIIGEDPRVALRHPDAVALLDDSAGGSVAVHGLIGQGSLWQLNRRAIGNSAESHAWLIELIDRTAEVDIGRAQTDFVANASHELRTPLASIIGYVETLSEAGSSGAPGTIDPATTSRFLGIVLREARRMQTLVADLMSLSQLEAEKHDVPRDPVDLSQIAAAVVGEFSATTAPGRLIVDGPGAGLTVAGDANQLTQLLRNLIDNALKYADDAPVVIRLIAPAGVGLVTLSVTDSGPGIARDHLPHLTRRFYRTDPGRSRAAGGTGLGLAIVKHIALRHRGKLDIASELGSGTIVTVQLPLVAGPVEAILSQ